MREQDSLRFDTDLAIVGCHIDSLAGGENQTEKRR